MNQISKIREEIVQYLNETQIVEDSRKSSLSPSENFKLDTVQYKQNPPDRNWIITKVKIHDVKENETIFEFNVDNDSFFHHWLTRDATEYLIFAETLCGGQSVIDLTHRILESYTTSGDGFIWTDFYPSPDKTKLAVVGCFWACPYEIKIYDFSNPLALPLPLISTLELNEEEKSEIIWSDNNHVRTESYDGCFRKQSI